MSWRSGRFIKRLLAAAAVPAAAALAQNGGHGAGHQHPAAPDRHEERPSGTPGYARSLAIYEPPDVVLLRMDGAEVSVASAFDHDGPVLLQFIFTTCPAVCPVLSATFQAAQSQLGDDLAKVRMVSISIDPEHDTPERLREYAKRFRAGRQWLFLTGRRDDVLAVQKSFDAYRGNKMRHEPVTFLRLPHAGSWLRFEGFLSAADLAAEVRLLLAARGDPALGEGIYLEGLLPSGEPLSATVAGDVAVTGEAFSCVSCHRRSGFGSVEGAALVPPVTPAALFGTRPPTRAENFRKIYQEVQPQPFAARARDPRVRPAYTDESLAVALREGRDPSGRVLDPWMPRYVLGRADMAHLIAYLKTLFATPDPGVDPSQIHFATVTSEGVDPEKRRALLEVAEAYVRRKNADTEGFLARPGHSPMYRDDFADAYREWVFSEWRLEGPPAGWRAQLEEAYREQPVFAILGGLGTGTWRPVHEFCEARRVPCLFPQTDLPPPEPGIYSLYLSRGLAGEAAALGRFLRETRLDGEELRVVQVYRDVEEGRALARALAEALGGDGGIHLEDRKLAQDAELAVQGSADVWVLWFDRADWQAGMRSLPSGRLFLSYSLAGEVPVPSAARGRVFLTYPFTLPGREVPRIYRVRAWLRSRGIELRHQRTQLNTFFAFSIADHALDHLVERFSRDYFIEEIEHETENALNPGVYPHLSLGPGQRFASKGSYIVALSEAGSPQAVSGWIVP